MALIGSFLSMLVVGFLSFPLVFLTQFGLAGIRIHNAFRTSNLRAFLEKVVNFINPWTSECGFHTGEIRICFL